MPVGSFYVVVEHILCEFWFNLLVCVISTFRIISLMQLDILFTCLCSCRVTFSVILCLIQ